MDWENGMYVVRDVVKGAGVTVVVVILVRRKKLRRLRIMYQSNYKKL